MAISECRVPAGSLYRVPDAGGPPLPIGDAPELMKRTDVWAFGAVLFEMLTGRSAFGGDDVSLTLARVLERQPDLSALPRSLHPKLREVWDRCPQKNPKKGFRDIGDVRHLIEEDLIIEEDLTETHPRDRVYAEGYKNEVRNRTTIPELGACRTPVR